MVSGSHKPELFNATMPGAPESLNLIQRAQRDLNPLYVEKTGVMQGRRANCLPCGCIMVHHRWCGD
jgi:hypothetical protein